MTNIGFIGLGKLGLPCAAAISVEAKVEVVGYDLNPAVKQYVEECKVPYVELLCEEYLSRSNIQIAESVFEVVQKSDMIFLAIQTPHEPRFEGITPVPSDLSDFDYSYLDSAISEITQALEVQTQKRIHIVVISTVLPGTMRKIVMPKLFPFGDRVKFSYNPFFIAMGQTISDFLDPEFVLIGGDSKEANEELRDFYSNIHSAPVKMMSLESAELTKVAYNTFIGFKIVFANSISEITSAKGGNVDEVTDALSNASMRLMSPKYMSAGMSDGGGCHPRDQIAMSWLAEDIKMSSDIFGFLAKARDAQTKRQAELILQVASHRKLPIVLLGKSYKAGINLTVGSPALLLAQYLDSLGATYTWFDPFVEPDIRLPTEPSLFFVSTNHEEFLDMIFPQGSTVIDPWKMSVKPQEGIDFIKPGRELIENFIS